MRENDTIAAFSRLAGGHESTAQLVEVLQAGLKRGDLAKAEVQRVLAALRTVLSEGGTAASSSLSCGFCGRSKDDTRTLVVAADSAICDECILTGVDALRRKESGLLACALSFVRTAAKLSRVGRGRGV